MKRICRLFLVLFVASVVYSPLCSAEHWVSMLVTDNAEWFFDGETAWFDSDSKKGGVNLKIKSDREQRAFIVNIKFYIDEYEADVERCYVRVYNVAGNQIATFYDGERDRFPSGTSNYGQIRMIANYALGNGR